MKSNIFSQLMMDSQLSRN